MTLRAPKGTDDIFPPQSRVWRRLLASWETWSARFGYELALTPVFESTEVFARGVGESTEVVQKQMYTFEDKGGRSLTLRPEGTASDRACLCPGGRGGRDEAQLFGPDVPLRAATGRTAPSVLSGRCRVPRNTFA